MTLRLAAALLTSVAIAGTTAYAALDEDETALEAVQAPPTTVDPQASADPVPMPVPAARAKGADRRAADAEPDAEPDEEVVADEDGEDEDDGDGYYVVGPPDEIPDCEAKLEEAGVEFTASRLPLHQTRGGITCGASQVVRYIKGPGNISWGGKPKVTCGVALAMARLELVVQQEAEREFSRPVKRIKHMGTYNCREMANYPGWVSEHSYANAIDIKYFELRGGKKIPVLGQYPKDGAKPKNAAGRFLKQVARRLYDEKVFSVVLTPSFDRAHRNHFHLDMARYLVDGT